jgi:glycosyltransferase involved in cell wall biosynthesis
MVKVSICLPTYKDPSGARRALQSIEEQTFSDYEVVVTDNSPDDAVGNVVKEFPTLKNLRYIKNPVGLGPAQNWNVNLSYARGQYVKIVHNDDWFSGPESLAKFVAALDNHPDSYFAFCQSHNISPSKDVEWISSPTSRFLKALRKDPLRLYPRNFVGAPSTIIFRRGPWRFDEQLKFVVDFDFYIAILREHPNFVFLDEPLMNISVGDKNQLTSSLGNNKEVGLFEFFYLYRKLFSRMQWRWDIFGLFYYLMKKYRVRSLLEIPDADQLPEGVRFFLGACIAAPDILSFIQSFRRRPSDKMLSR